MARPLLELQACSPLSGQAFLISTFAVAHDCCPAACPGDDTNGRALAIPTGMGRLSTSLQSSSSPGLIKTNCQNCAVWTCAAIRPGLLCNYRADEQSWRTRCFGLVENTTLMTHGRSRYPNCVKLPNHPYHTGGHARLGSSQEATAQRARCQRPGTQSRRSRGGVGRLWKTDWGIGHSSAS